MSPHYTPSQRATILGSTTAGLLFFLALAAAPGRPSQSESSRLSARKLLTDSLVLAVNYAGIGAEGVDLIWHGTRAGPLPGQTTIRMSYTGAPEDRTMPVWPINALLFFSADDYRSSFIAELSGTMDWERGEMRAAGLVTDGATVGTQLEQVLRLSGPERNGSLTIRFLPTTPLQFTMKH